MQALIFHRLLDLLMVVDVNLMPGYHHIQVRTLLPRFPQSSSGTYTECLGFITGGNADR